MKLNMKSKNNNSKKEQKNLDINTVSRDISVIFKGISALVFIVLMLFIVIKKISNIKDIQMTGWLSLVVAFVLVSLIGVKMSNILEQKTNFNENICMNISIVIVFSVIGGIVYLFWDQFFCALFI